MGALLITTERYQDEVFREKTLGKIIDMTDEGDVKYVPRLKKVDEFDDSEEDSVNNRVNIAQGTVEKFRKDAQWEGDELEGKKEDHANARSKIAKASVDKLIEKASEKENTG